jgi:hypothetical protein
MDVILNWDAPFWRRFGNKVRAGNSGVLEFGREKKAVSPDTTTVELWMGKTVNSARATT